MTSQKHWSDTSDETTLSDRLGRVFVAGVVIVGATCLIWLLSHLFAGVTFVFQNAGS